MSNETKPLLSDRSIDARMEAYTRILKDERGESHSDALKHVRGFQYGMLDSRDLYEADRSKLMAVLQVCADALNKSQYVILRMADGPNREAWGPQLDTNDDALSQLRSIGIEPNK